MLYTLGNIETEKPKSRLGLEREIEGTIHKVNGNIWSVAIPHKIDINIDDKYQVPAEKGDLFGGKIKLVEESPDKWELTNYPIVKIPIDEEAITAMIKRNFRCSLEKARSIVFHLKDRADKFHCESLQEFIDEQIGTYIRVPSDETLDIIFPREKKENILRFFRFWSATLARRVELFGISRDMMRKELKRPPSEIYRLILENPLKISDLPLEKAKEVLLRLNRAASPTELKCAQVLRFIYKQLQNGDIYVNYPLVHKIFNLTTEEFYLLEDYGVYGERETGRLFLKEVFLINDELATILYNKLNGVCPQRKINMNLLDPKLNDMQKFALVGALSLPLTIITGKGGCGKSTVIGEIYKQEEDILLMAFTGKAVARLSEITQSKDPSTIHKAISKLEITEKTKHIIIDEATMACTELVYKLLKAFPYPKYNYRITLVGDPNQLPPIEWGSFFEQLIKSNKVPIFTLMQNMRVENENGIQLNCDKLLKHIEDNKTAKAVTPFNFTLTPNFSVRRGTLKDAVSILEMRYNMGNGIDDTVILTPYKDCVDQINNECKSLFNKGKRSVKDSRGSEWTVGYPVCNRINNYTKNIMNGERGKIHDVQGNKVIVKMNDEFYNYSTHVLNTFIGTNYLIEKHTTLTEDEATNTGSLSLDFASTVHSYQGSEKPNVIIYIPMGHKANMTEFLNGKLVYTMISRAKSKVWIIGDIDALCVSAVTPTRVKNDNFIELFLSKFTPKEK